MTPECIVLNARPLSATHPGGEDAALQDSWGKAVWGQSLFSHCFPPCTWPYDNCRTAEEDDADAR